MTTALHTGSQREPVPPEVLRVVKQVEIKARILADEAMVGTYRSVFRGSGLDFEEVREYEPGDDIRSIDWNVTARMNAPYIKKYREERELNIYIAVDVSSSAWFGTGSVSKRELAADVAALLAVTALHNNDRVGLVLFADGVREFIPPQQGRHHLLHVIRQLLFAEPRRSPTEIASVADYLANVTKKRNVVFVVSDFLDVDFEAPLRALAHKHDVIALILNDPREVELPSVGLVALEDAESGRVGYLDTSDPAVLEAIPPQVTRIANGRTRYTFRYRITAFRVGDLVFPSISVAYQSPAGVPGVAPTTEIPIVITSVTQPGEATDDIKPAKPQLRLPNATPQIPQVAIQVALALVVLVMLAFLIRQTRRGAGRRPKDTEMDEVLLTPAQRALAELNRVASLGLPEKGRYAEHYAIL